MLTTVYYCIDYPFAAEKQQDCDHVEGWLLADFPVLKLSISEEVPGNPEIIYGYPRPDVAAVFPQFRGSANCAFVIRSAGKRILTSQKIPVDLWLEMPGGKQRTVRVELDLNTTGIQETEWDEHKKKSDRKFEKAEKKFLKALKGQAGITLRLDITNKCNLRCIMCHYKEEEIHSKPVQNLIPEELKQQLQSISPFVKHIMLSCGFEPLMSKHFTDILAMIHTDFPHISMSLCTNATLLNSEARAAIIRHKVTNVLLSLDGVSKAMVEQIRVGARYEKVIGNIMALRDLKRKHGLEYPRLTMDYVMMDRNLHEAIPFVEMCADLGISTIDYRHMVGNIFFADDPGMLHHHPAKYAYYRKRILEASARFNLPVRLPEAQDPAEEYVPDPQLTACLDDYRNCIADEQSVEIIPDGGRNAVETPNTDFLKLLNVSCSRPFDEMMIIDQHKVFPCAFYNEEVGRLEDGRSLSDIFYGEKFREVRRKKVLGRYDRNCANCPIAGNLLATRESH